MKVNVFGTFVVDACVSDAINSQYPNEGAFHERVKEERGCIVNFASAVANPVPARCLTYGPTKSESMVDPLGRSCSYFCHFRSRCIGYHDRRRRFPRSLWNSSLLRIPFGCRIQDDG